MKIANMKCLGMKNPLGVDRTPYFSWMLESEKENTMQTSYRITVSDERGIKVWDSGVTDTQQNTYILYEGNPLSKCRTYHWNVTVTDNCGCEAQADAIFETAFLQPREFPGNWILAPMKRKKPKAGFGKQDAATMFRKEFHLKEKPVKARLYATCHGIYEASLNGKPVSDRLFAPEHTVYGKYLCYQTYDVTELLSDQNVLGFYVGDGWYHCPNAKPNLKKIENRHALLFALAVTYEDGSEECICSDTQVKASYGPIRHADLYAGEKYDASLEQKGWDTPGFSDNSWHFCKEAKFDKDNLIAQLGNPVKIVKRLPVKEILRSPKGEYILDFGQNMAGVVELHTTAPAGTIITLEHTEVLDRDGNYINNIMGAGGVGAGCDQKDQYICSGGEASYRPHFTYHGFRYVRVTGIEPKAEDFTACVFSTDMENTGTFSCSDDALNRLYKNIRWSQTSNMLSIPTDCPQREKAGWTGDMLVFSKTAQLNEDCEAFFTRWLENMACDQDKYGIIPMVVPENGNYPMVGKFMMMSYGEKGKGTSSGWGDAAVTVPYSMYEITGNTEILKSQYSCMKRWCDYIIGRAAAKKPKKSSLPDEIEHCLWDTGYHYGEWLIPSQNKNGLDMKNLKSIMASSSCYTAPIFGWNSVNIFAKIAEILGRKSDASRYQAIADKMKEAFQKGVIREDGSMPSALMGAYVLPLYFDLVPDNLKEQFAANLVTSIEKNNYRMDTGFLGTPFLLDTLCKIGRRDLAYRLLWQDEKPSWLSEVKEGATTIWENCFGYDEQGNPGSLSFNHYSFGCVADWIYRNINGIIPQEPGFKKILIAPQPDERLTFARREFCTPQGVVSVFWKKENGTFFMRAEIPCNTTAAIRLPNGTEVTRGSGTWEIQY